MAIMSRFGLFHLALFSLLIVSCSSFNPRLLNVSKLSGSGWSTAGATWYGTPNGAGSDGGACGYTNAVDQAPFSSFVTAGDPSLFKSGEGCGACYEVKCTKDTNPACSGSPVRVVMTDSCPGCPDSPHFDLSGTAFGAMAASNQAEQLRNAGILHIQHRRVPCNYPGVSLAFRVDAGSNAEYFAAVIEYENGDGDLTGVALKQAANQDTDEWVPMQQSWGAVWKLDAGSELKAPFSLKLTGDSGRFLVVNNAIPAGWKPGNTYRTVVNFKV